MISLIISVVLVGFLVWAVTYFIPMPEKFKTAVYVLAGLFLLLYGLEFFGVWSFADLHRHYRR